MQIDTAKQHRRTNICHMTRKLKWLILPMIFILCGCSQELSYEQAKDDFLTYSSFSNITEDTMEVTSYKILKDDERNGIAWIWVNVTGESETAYVERSYKITYCLYDSGWFPEKYEPFYGTGSSNKTEPKTQPTLSDVKWFLEKNNDIVLPSYHTINSASMLKAIPSKDGYTIRMKYSYPLVDEIADIPLAFEFQPTKGTDEEWRWVATPHPTKKRFPQLSSSILGVWKKEGLDLTHWAASMVVDGITTTHNDSLGMDLYSNCSIARCMHQFRFIPRTNQSARLVFGQDKETGEINSLRLEWTSAKNPGWTIILYPDGSDTNEDAFIQIKKNILFNKIHLSSDLARYKSPEQE